MTLDRGNSRFTATAGGGVWLNPVTLVHEMLHRYTGLLDGALADMLGYVAGSTSLTASQWISDQLSSKTDCKGMKLGK